MIDEILREIDEFNQFDVNEVFVDFLKKVRPMTGAGVIQLLNRCVSCIDSDKCYFEVGVHRGSTLLGAAMDNEVMCFGLDNFSGHNEPHEIFPFSSVEEGLQDGIKRLSSGNVKYFKEDYHNFFQGKENIEGKKIEVYFYDGDHNIENQYLGIKLALPLLADRAIILVDDSGNNDSSAVHGAIQTLLKENLGLSIIKEFYPSKPNDLDGMWCGVLALMFDRSKYITPTTFRF